MQDDTSIQEYLCAVSTQSAKGSYDKVSCIGALCQSTLSIVSACTKTGLSYTVHDTENLTFSEKFRGCFAQTPADSYTERRGSSAPVPRIFQILRRRTRVFRAGGCGSSVRIQVEMAETRRRTLCATTLKDRDTRRKDRLNYNCKNITCLEMKY